MVSETMERALQFLRNHKDVALATSEGDIPKLRIFQVMKQEGNVLYFATSEAKAVWRELRKNPNVELIAYEGNISVRCSGMVNFNVEEETKRWIYEHNDVLRRLYTSYDQMAYFCLPIAEMDYYDLQPTPPVLLHFDLMAGEVTSNSIALSNIRQ
jgi:uncharacterized pyridoxamine 5'-phosphate oxidase family protein